MCGMGLDQTACALVGFQIGAGDIKKAETYYRLLINVGAIIVMLQASLLFLFR